VVDALLARRRFLHRVFRADAFERFVGAVGFRLALVRFATVVVAVLFGFVARRPFGLLLARVGRGIVLVFFLFLAARVVGLLFQQGFAVRDRNLVVVGVDFAEGEEAVPVTAIFDERRLKRRFDAGHLG